MQIDKPDLLTKYKLIEIALTDEKLKHSRLPRAVLFKLMEHDGKLGCFPGKSLLARECSTHISQVRWSHFIGQFGSLAKVYSHS